LSIIALGLTNLVIVVWASRNEDRKLLQPPPCPPPPSSKFRAHLSWNIWPCVNATARNLRIATNIQPILPKEKGIELVGFLSPTLFLSFKLDVENFQSLGKPTVTKMFKCTSANRKIT
jgi:hypothetical protein